MTYSIDFRRKVLDVRERDRLSIAQVAERFAVGKATVMCWLKRIERKPSGFRRRKLDVEVLAADLRDYPDAYQYERAARLGVTQNAICYALKNKLGVPHKKNAGTSNAWKPPRGAPFKTGRWPMKRRDVRWFGLMRAVLLTIDPADTAMPPSGSVATDALTGTRRDAPTSSVHF